jgi:hypothetical protein
LPFLLLVFLFPIWRRSRTICSTILLAHLLRFFGRCTIVHHVLSWTRCFNLPLP